MLLEEQIPKIKKIIKEKLGNLSANTYQNEELMRNSFRRLYQSLPRMIRIAISEKKFEDFCMINRERLLNFGDSVSHNFTDTKSENIISKDNNQSFKKNYDLDKNKLANTTSMLEKAKKYFLPIYSPDLLIIRGKDSRVWDSNDNEYIDFGAGISVNNLGHNNSDLFLTMNRQAEKLWHTSNLYLNEPSIRLAEYLVKLTFADRVYFCNSGAEANEAAIKISRKYSSLNFSHKKKEIITFEGSFHGRTLATITATAQPKYQNGFEPLPKRFSYCPFNDFDAASKKIGSETCAVMIEPIQGEGGVNLAKSGFLKHLRQLCDKNNALLIFDEIQCGLGRTGKLFAYQWEDLENEKSKIYPDILTTAKSLGGGLPFGAMLCTEKVGQSFKPGDHGTTFGGNPIIASIAKRVLEKINTKQMFLDISQKGSYIKNQLQNLNDKINLFENIRGRGMMIGADLSKAWNNRAHEIVFECRNNGVLILAAGPNVIRLLPALNITNDEIEEGMDRVCKALTKFHNEELTKI